MSSIMKPFLGTQLSYGHSLSRGLVGCWLMNEGSGNKVFDSSGNGNTGTMSGTEWTSGKYGHAQIFSTADEINFGTPASLYVDHITIAAWIKIPNLTSWTPIYHNGSYNTSGIWFALSTTELLCMYHTAEGSAYDSFVSAGSAVPIGEWAFVAGTWNGVTKTVYLNGRYNGSETINPGNIDWSNGNDFVIGVGDYGVPNYTLSHLYVYGRAFSASEIALLYREPFCMFDRDLIELRSAATQGGGAPPPTTGIMTCNTGYWGSI